MLLAKIKKAKYLPHLKCRMAAERRVLAAKRRLAQLVEHLSYTQQVAGSNPASPTCSEKNINRADCGSISAMGKHLETGAFLNLQNRLKKLIKILDIRTRI